MSETSKCPIYYVFRNQHIVRFRKKGFDFFCFLWKKCFTFAVFLKMNYYEEITMLCSIIISRCFF